MDYSKLKPMHGIIVVKMETKDVSEGGIHFVETKRVDHGTVVATGPGEWIDEKGKKPRFREVGVKPGDTIVVGPGSGVVLETTIDEEKEKLLYLSENDIVGVIRS